MTDKSIEYLIESFQLAPSELFRIIELERSRRLLFVPAFNRQKIKGLVIQDQKFVYVGNCDL